MSCQICVEVCPFEAIKMNTEFELSTDDRFGGLLLDRKELAKSNEYYHTIHPTEATEVDARLAQEKAKVEAKAKTAAEAAAAKAAAVATGASAAAATANPAAAPVASPSTTKAAEIAVAPAAATAPAAPKPVAGTGTDGPAPMTESEKKAASEPAKPGEGEPKA